MRTFVLLIAGVALAASACASGSTTKPAASARLPAPAVRAADTDRGYSLLDNGHQNANTFEQPMSSATRALLAHQLLLARMAAMQYPTVKDAEAAGWTRTGPFAPGLGAHYFNFHDIGDRLMADGVVDDFDALHPTSLIYDGTAPNSPIAGLMYYSTSVRLPKGFAGPNDVWHYHNNVCLVYKGDGSVDTPYGADQTVSQKMCDDVHGALMRKTQYMLHAWVVPGYDSPEGVFSHLNPAITCKDGTYYMKDLEKIGDAAYVGDRTSVCRDGGE